MYITELDIVALTIALMTSVTLVITTAVQNARLMRANQDLRRALAFRKSAGEQR